jgi:uncharacterized protein YukE
MEFSGADTERLRSLATEAEAVLDVVQSARVSMERLVQRMPSIWVGADADAFVSQAAAQHLPALQRAIGRLGAATHAMRQAAVEQDQTSNRLH